MASDHPCNSVLELSSQWVSLLVKSGMVLPSKLDTKWAVTPSKNKPLKLVNLWCIPTAKVPVQEYMEGPVHWSGKYLVIHLAHIASQGN